MRLDDSYYTITLSLNDFMYYFGLNGEVKIEIINNYRSDFTSLPTALS